MSLEMRAFEVALIRDLDEAALAFVRSKAGKGGMKNLTSGKDGAGVASFMRGLAERRNKPKQQAEEVTDG